MSSLTTFMQWAINTSGGGLPATQLIDNVSGSIGARQEIVDSTGQNSSLTGRTNRMRVVALPVEPTFNMEPTAQEWAYLLPWLLGGTPSGTGPITHVVGNDLPLRGIQGVEDRAGSAYAHNYTNIAVDSFTISSRPGQLVGLGIRGVSSGGTYENTTAFPSLANFDNTTSPFAFPDLTGDGASGADGVFTIGGVARQAFSIEMTCNYGLDRGRMPHSLAAVGLRKRERTITIGLDMPAADAQAIYATDKRDLETRAVMIRYRNPVESIEYLEIELPSVIFPMPEIQLPARAEVRVPVVGMAKFDGTNSPLTIRLQIRT